jgi:hypothetical protein
MSTEETQERARRAYERAKILLRSEWTPLVRMLARKPKMTVQLTSGTPRTDGRTTWLRVPIELGDDTPHTKAVCGVRSENGPMLCPACDVLDDVSCTIYHEAGHTTEGSFDDLDDADKKAIIQAAVKQQASASKRIELVQKRLEENINFVTNYIAAASLVSPYLPLLLNAVEDVWVNTRIMEYRPGTIKSFRAKFHRVFEQGIENDDGTVMKWSDQPLNAQITIGLFCLGSKINYVSALDPKVVKDLDDPVVQQLVASIPTLTRASLRYKLAVRLLDELQRLGYLAPPEIPEMNQTDEEPEQEPQQGEGEGSEEEGSDEESTDGQDGDSGDSGDDSDSDESEQDDDDAEGSGSGDDSDDDESEQDDGDEADGDGDGDGGNKSDEDDDDAEGSGGDSDSDSDDESEQDDDADGEGSGSGDDSDEESEQDDDAGGEGSDGSGGDDEGDEEDDDSPSNTEMTDDGRQVGKDERSDAEQSEEGGDADDEALGDESDSGSAPDEDSEAQPIPPQGFGDPEETDSLFKHFGQHDEDETPPTPEERRQQEEVERAIRQADHFDKPSRLLGLKVVSSDECDDSTNPYQRQHAFGADPLMPEIHPSMIGPALAKARIVFTMNKRGKVERNLEAGQRLDGRVLARRFATGDPRLFEKRSRPGKRSYFVCVGIDCSGSTSSYGRIGMIRAAALAQGDLLARLGIDFAMYAHSGDGEGVMIHEIKRPQDPWGAKQREAVGRLRPFGGNLDGHTLEFYRKVLDRRSETDRLILYYTDGQMPAGNFNEELAVLQDNIDICRRKSYTLLGVGVHTDSPEEHGLETVRLDGPQDIAKVVDRLRSKFAGPTSRPDFGLGGSQGAGDNNVSCIL